MTREEFAKQERAMLLGLSSTQLMALATRALDEIERLEAWVADLQSGMYVNCVYCGHRYGPKETTPVSMADALKAHVEKCEKHPMATMASQLCRLRSALEMIRSHGGAWETKIAREALGEPA